MTPEQKDTYIELLENFKNIIVKNNRGWRMDELGAIKAIEEFENSLPCNQEGGLTPLALDGGDPAASEQLSTPEFYTPCRANLHPPTASKANR